MTSLLRLSGDRRLLHESSHHSHASVSATLIGPLIGWLAANTQRDNFIRAAIPSSQCIHPFVLRYY